MATLALNDALNFLLVLFIFDRVKITTYLTVLNLGSIIKSENGHSIGNYYVIRHLSQKNFKNEFEEDLNKWKKIKVKRINNTAFKLLKENTKFLKNDGRRSIYH